MPQHESHRNRSVFRGCALLAGAFLAALAAAPAQAQRADGGEWIPTWAASVQPVWEPDFFAPVGIPRALRNQTIRQIARVSLAGSRPAAMDCWRTS